MGVIDITEATPAVATLGVLLDKLRVEQDNVRASFEARINELQTQISAVETTIQLLGGRGAADSQTVAHASDASRVSLDAWRRRLRGKTQLEALVEIARSNGGILRVSDARSILIAAKLATGNPKNVGPMLHHILRDSSQFRRVGPGTFRLLEMPMLGADVQAVATGFVSGEAEVRNAIAHAQLTDESLTAASAQLRPSWGQDAAQRRVGELS